MHGLRNVECCNTFHYTNKLKKKYQMKEILTMTHINNFCG
jgi:hypothetical protein